MSNIPIVVVDIIGRLAAIFVIDRYGRRYLLTRTMPVLLLAWIAVAAGMFTQPMNAGHTTYGGFMVFLGTMVWMFAFGLGVSPTVYAVCAEIFPLHVISAANAVTQTTQWVVNYFICYSIPLMLNDPEQAPWAYVILSCFIGATWFFVYQMVPETARRTIEQNLQAIL
jgi:MFS family permease